MRMKRFVFLYVLLAGCLPGTYIHAQNTRISNHNTIGWYNYFGTFTLNKKISIHTEYQWRRAQLVTQWQQSLLRLGINYQLHPKVQLRLGYAWVETFPYGDIPLNGFGKRFTEHRLFQMATITDKIAPLELAHRFMLEQRWVGRYSTPNLTTEDKFVFLNRLRYMFRLQLPLRGKSMANQTPYIALYDELFAGFWKNTGENVFDQNRSGLLLGYRFNNTCRVEGGYLSQIVQLGREVNGRNVFQYNNGLIMNALFTIDLRKTNNGHPVK